MDFSRYKLNGDLPTSVQYVSGIKGSMVVSIDL